jgi:CHASE3 domain sensor protein
MANDPKGVSRGQFDRVVGNLNHEIKILKQEIEELKKEQKKNMEEQQTFYRNVIRALLGILASIITGVGALFTNGVKF